MSIHDDIESLRSGVKATVALDLPSGLSLDVERRSVQWLDGGALMVVREGGRRRLLVMGGDASGLTVRFSGERVTIEPGITACVGDLDHSNAVAVREVCEIARPQPLGLGDSFGLGDRLGIAGPAHLRALRGTGFNVVLAQQSIRELERTERTPEEVMDAATWAILEEGW
ncbi:MAG: tagaturonate epimerase family protein, partial [Acidobacteriota bacterium]